MLSDAEKAAKYDAIAADRLQRMRAWRIQNPDRYKEYQAAYKLAHKDELKAYNTAHTRERRQQKRAEAAASAVQPILAVC